MSGRGESGELDLGKAAEILLDECRMMLPGIQAIFGFQLIAVFNQRFTELDSPLQVVHLGALALMALAAALVMTPAAYHRQREPRAVSAAFLTIASRLMLAATMPLAAGLALDVYLIAVLVLGPESWGAAMLAGGIFAAMALLWYVFPHARPLHRALAS